MYAMLAILAAIVLIYGTVAGRLERTPVSGAMVFLGIGVLLGPVGLGVLELSVGTGEIRLLAELTLALVLFAEAADADLAVLRRAFRIPARLLAVGLPLTIALGFALGVPVFPELTLLEVALLATMLAPTDAALGKAVVTNPDVPPSVREGLKVEAGLNDGICVPVLFAFLAVAAGTAPSEDSTIGLALGLFVQEIGIGAVVGVAFALGAGSTLGRLARRGGWIGRTWLPVLVPALALLCFATAQALHGSGLIAAFMGGITVAVLRPEKKHEWLHAAESAGDTLSLLTWVVFGAAVVGEILPRFGWDHLAYALLSLTVIRMLPMFLALTGLPLGADGKLFVGWFGPRGLVSIVFVIIVLDAGLPGGEDLAMTVACTVVLSILAHGLSAVPLARLYAARVAAGAASDPAREGEG
ncbi:MAG: cation:proton antiporter [Rhodospirillales bacterium]|nr:cation:proton antiporter [Rhodospirillales bacterium]